MILVAVAVLLIAWGAFSLIGNKDDSSQQAAQSSNSGQNSGANGAQKSGANSAGQGQIGAQNSAGAPTSGAPASGSAQPPAGAPGAGQGGVVNKATEYIAVLNNSPIKGLAGDVANKLHGKQWEKTGVGNLPDNSGVFPNSVVLYPKGNPAAKTAAEQMASDLGIKAQERSDATDRTIAGVKMLEGQPPAGIVVVTTNDMPR